MKDIKKTIGVGEYRYDLTLLNGIHMREEMSDYIVENTWKYLFKIFGHGISATQSAEAFGAFFQSPQNQKNS